MRRILIYLCSLILLMQLTACARPVTESDPEAAEREVRYVEAMDTFMTLTACGTNRSKALDAAEAEIHRLDALLSVGNPDSEISAINRKGSGILSADTRVMVAQALELFKETGGCFDITVLPLVELWGFTSGDHRVPSESQLADALSTVGADRLSYQPDSGELTLSENQSIDLGGIAKGYTSQRIMELYRAAGLTSGLVSLGGNVQCLGARPDGTPWRIGIQDPWGAEGAMVAVVEIVDQAVITSGGYERYFTDESTGITYQHILDPKTGMPADGGLASVSIVSSDGTLADGLSTALYIMGLERATEYWRGHSGEFQAILIDNDGSIYVTEGLSSTVTPVSSDADLIVLTKS